MTGIYTIENSNKYYIGYAIDIEDRLCDHKYNLRLNKHANRHLQRAWNKNKGEGFLFEVLAECKPEFLASEENFWCNMLDTHNPKRGYNIKPTNPNKVGGNSKETREKIRIANTGKKQKLETIQRRVESIKKNYVPGTRNHSEETKLKISINRKGKGGESKKGVKMPEEHKKKLIAINTGRIPWNKGLSMPEETRKKVSESKKGKNYSKIKINNTELLK